VSWARPCSPVPPAHRLAGQAAVALTDLAHDVLGTTPADLFPGRALSQRQALEQAGIRPPTIDLADTDLTATRWALGLTP